jgi:hypothetical protein
MPENCFIPCNRPPPTDHREGTGPEDSGWFTVVGRCRTPVESRTGDDTAHRAVTAVQRCPSGSRSARSVGTPWANSQSWLADCRRLWTGCDRAAERSTDPLRRITRSISLFRAANASDPRQWQGSEIDGPAIGRSPELLLSARDRPSLNLSSMRSQLSERLRKPAEPRRTAVRARRPRSRSPGPTPGSRRSAHGRERCATRAGPLPP